MNRNFRVVTINGVRGIFAAIFIVLGLIAGFVISPGFVCMKAWNYFFKDSLTFSQMNLFQGILAWSIIALALYVLNNKKALIGFGSYRGITPSQMKEIMRRTKDCESDIIKEIESKIKEISLEKENSINNNIQENIEKEDQKEEIRR